MQANESTQRQAKRFQEAYAENARLTALYTELEEKYKAQRRELRQCQHTVRGTGAHFD